MRSCAPFIAFFAMSGRCAKMVAGRGWSHAERPEGGWTVLVRANPWLTGLAGGGISYLAILAAYAVGVTAARIIQSEAGWAAYWDILQLYVSSACVIRRNRKTS